MHGKKTRVLSVSVLAEAIWELPSPWRAVASMAQGYLATGQLELAEAVFVQVGQLAHPSAPAWAGAVLAAASRGDRHKAASYTEILAATDPGRRLYEAARTLVHRLRGPS